MAPSSFPRSGASNEPRAVHTDAYVLRWAAGDVDLVRKTAENVRRVAGEVLDAAYERVPELDRAKSIESEAVERHQAHELVTAR